MNKFRNYRPGDKINPKKSYHYLCKLLSPTIVGQNKLIGGDYVEVPGSQIINLWNKYRHSWDVEAIFSYSKVCPLNILVQKEIVAQNFAKKYDLPIPNFDKFDSFYWCNTRNKQVKQLASSRQIKKIRDQLIEKYSCFENPSSFSINLNLGGNKKYHNVGITVDNRGGLVLNTINRSQANDLVGKLGLGVPPFIIGGHLPSTRGRKLF